MKLPKTIRVGVFNIRVKQWSVEKANSARRYGEFDPVARCIRVQKMAPIKMADTLLHELLHAICWVYGVEDKDDEERLANMLSTALLQVFRDNPSVIKFISKCAKQP